VAFRFKLRETPQFHRRKPFLLSRISHVPSIKIKAVCFMNDTVKVGIRIRAVRKLPGPIFNIKQVFQLVYNAH